MKVMLTYNPLKYIRAETAENKYKVGDVVIANADPTKKLVIQRYSDRVYYCKVQRDPEAKELAYFEMELAQNNNKEADKK